VDKPDGVTAPLMMVSADELEPRSFVQFVK